MRIGGFAGVSLIDYPGCPASVLFTQGCNFRCPYCHNPSLVYPDQYQSLVQHKKIFNSLAERKKIVDGVVITGGEPLLQPDLESWIVRIKSMGFKVKLDTNGSNPCRLRRILSLVDYVAMDIKAPFCTHIGKKTIYETITGVQQVDKPCMLSFELLKRASCDVEFRTTYDRTLLREKDIDSLRILTKGFKYTVNERK